MVREAAQEANEPVHLLIDPGVLAVGADMILAMTPQVVHTVEFRAPLGQPDQPDAQLGGQLLGARGGMAGVLVQEQGDTPATVVAADDRQEGPEILSFLPLADQE
jgi:hypothetical protein